jgi:hypothetical protein
MHAGGHRDPPATKRTTRNPKEPKSKKDLSVLRVSAVRSKEKDLSVLCVSAVKII